MNPPQTEQAKEILRLQILEDPDFVAKKDALWALVVEAQSKIRICPEPEYGILAANLAKAQNNYVNLGADWVAHVRGGALVRAIEHEQLVNVTTDDARVDRHNEVNREAMRRARKRPK